MPSPAGPVLREEQGVSVRLGLDPAQNLFYSLFLLARANKYSGLGKWIESARIRLDPDILDLNLKITHGLYGAIKPGERYASFEGYLNDLEERDPQLWVARLFDYYEQVSGEHSDLPQIPARGEMLADFDLFLEYLVSSFGPERVDEPVERQAHLWINNPEQMRREVVAHLRTMWERELEQEWRRSIPALSASLEALQELRVDVREPLEAVRLASGQSPDEWMAKKIEQAEQVILVPSLHLGPYVGQLENDQTLWILYGARVPHGSSVRSRELDRSQLLMRLNALADDTRLQIIETVKMHREVCAQDVIADLEISQSSASRHLRQLAANGLLRERRVDGAKCYQLHEEGAQATLKSLADFLGRKSPGSRP